MPRTQVQKVRFRRPLSHVRLASSVNLGQTLGRSKPSDKTAQPRADLPEPESSSGEALRDEEQAKPIDTSAIEALFAKISSELADYHRNQQLQTRQLEEATIRLAVLLASHLVGQSLKAGDFQVAPLLANAVARLGNPAKLTVRLHPTDLANVGEIQDKTTASLPELDLIPDETVDRGGCVVSDGRHQLVANMEQRLEDVQRELIKGLSSARS